MKILFLIKNCMIWGVVAGLCLCLNACGLKNNGSDKEPQSLEVSIEEMSTTEPMETEPGKEISEEDEKSKYPILAVPITIKYIDFAIDSEGVYCIFDGSKFGYMTETGEELTACIYDTGAPFSEGLACVSKDGKYGFIDKTGEEVLPLIYEDASSFTEGLAYFVKDGEYGFMTADGEAAFYLECDSVSSFSDGLAYFSIDGKYGYIDQTGKVVIEPVYGMADFFEDGYAVVSNSGYEGVIDKQGKEIVPIIYDSITKQEDIWVAKNGDVFDFFDREGKLSFSDNYDHIYSTEEGYIVNVNEVTGYVNKDGEEVIAPAFDSLGRLTGTDYFVVEKDELYGVIDKHGAEVVPFIYDWAWFRADEVREIGLLEVGKDGKYGCLSIDDFTFQIPLEYDSMGYWGNGYAAVCKYDCWGIIDKNGEILAPIVYQWIGVLDNGAVELKKDGMQWLYSQDGKLLLEGTWEYIILKDEYYVVKQKEKYIILDSLGNEVLNYESSYGSQEVVGSRAAEIYRLDEYDKEGILKFADTNNEAIIKDLILQNKITPKKQAYWEIVQSDLFTGKNADGSETECFLGESWYDKTCYLFDIDNSGSPLLYYYAEPAYQLMFPLSDSAIFTMQDGEAVLVLKGCECGGSMRGDYVCFWREKETGELLIGTKGAVGGFGGIATMGSVYRYENGILEDRFSYHNVYQSASNYERNELFEKAYLFYDDNGEPYTEETIVDAEMVEEYMINDENVTKETYEERLAGYEYVNIKMVTSYLR